MAPAGFTPGPQPLGLLAGMAAQGLVPMRRGVGRRLAGSAAMRRVLLFGSVGNGSRLSPQDARLMLEASRGARRMRQAITAVVRADLRPVLAALETPFGLIWGEQDRMVDFSGFGRLHRRPPRHPGADPARHRPHPPARGAGGVRRRARGGARRARSRRGRARALGALEAQKKACREGAWEGSRPEEGSGRRERLPAGGGIEVRRAGRWGPARSGSMPQGALRGVVGVMKARTRAANSGSAAAISARSHRRLVLGLGLGPFLELLAQVGGLVGAALVLGGSSCSGASSVASRSSASRCCWPASRSLVSSSGSRSLIAASCRKALAEAGEAGAAVVAAHRRRQHRPLADQDAGLLGAGDRRVEERPREHARVRAVADADDHRHLAALGLVDRDRVGEAERVGLVVGDVQRAGRRRSRARPSRRRGRPRRGSRSSRSSGPARARCGSGSAGRRGGSARSAPPRPPG